MFELTQEQRDWINGLPKLKRRVVEERIANPNLSDVECYRLAGGKAKKLATQHSSVSEILKHPEVERFLDEIKQQSMKSSIMTRDEALERLSKSARIKITDICTFKLVELTDAKGEKVTNTVWEMKNSEDIDPDVAACIKSVTFTKTGPKIELYDANGSIKLLSDLQGWNAPKKQEITGPGGGPIQTKELSDDDFLESLQGLGIGDGE